MSIKFTGGESFIEFPEKIRDYLNAYVEGVDRVAQKACKSAGHKFIKEYKKIVEEEFMWAVHEFYESYDPRSYVRNYSLYDILDIESDVADTSREISFTYGFDNDKVTKDRRGNSLYRKVFIYGFHGGAESGDWTRIRYGKHQGELLYTPHPAPVPTLEGSGKTYWRDMGTWFRTWGDPAVRTKSPYDIFTEEMEKKNSYVQDRWQELFSDEVGKYNNELIKELQGLVK